MGRIITNYFSAILLAFTFNTVFAESSEFDPKKVSDELAQCGGVFQAMSVILKSMGKSNAAQTYEDTGRGAYLSAAHLSNIASIIPDWKNAISWSTNQSEINKSYWLGLIELHTPTEENPLPDGFMAELKFCTDLNPVQTEIVNMMRDQLYSQPNGDQ